MDHPTHDGWCPAPSTLGSLPAVGRAIAAFVVAVCVAPQATAQTQWQQLYPSSAPSAGGDRLAYVSSCACVVSYGGFAHSEMWKWDGTTWTLVSTTPPPGARWGHGMSHDTRRGTLLVFGGGSGYWRDDLWEWDGQTWTEHRPASPPPGRFRMPMAYDEHRDVHVVFGGEGPFITYGDTWEWSPSHGTWTRPLLAQEPPARLMQGLAYDRLRQEIVLFGGITTPGGSAFGDTWTYDGATWTQRTPASSPSPRAPGIMTWDDDRGRIVMVGGDTLPWGGSASMGLNDTWEWDGANWIQRSTTASPPTGVWTSAYDPLRRETVWLGYGQGALRTWTYTPTTPADATPFGSGCASGSSSRAVPVLGPAVEPANLPWVGSTLTAEMTNAPPGGRAVLILGGSNSSWVGAPLPLSLASFGGGPGCSLLVSADVLLPMTDSNQGRAQASLPIPNVASLVGASVYAQGLVFESPASQTRLTVTQGLTLDLGAK